MKKIFKSMMFLAAAATALTACNKEADIQETGKTGEMETLRFYAVVNDAETKATLTTEDEKTFKAAWEEGDKMDIEVSGGNNRADVFSATRKGSYFEFDIPSDWTEEGTWSYRAYYPSKTSVPFGADRVQNGSNYASQYDVMLHEYSTFANSKCGYDSKGDHVVLPMSRVTSILYFHLTSDLEETLQSATLTVEGGDIAAETLTYDDSEIKFVASEGSQTFNTITLTFKEETAPSAKDFCLWYNILPVDATGLTLTVTTTSGKTATLANTKGKTYAAGKLNKIVKSGLTWEEKPFFYESFNQTNGTGGNDDLWSGTIASSTIVTDNNGWTFEREGGANQCVKIGTGSAKGYALTPALGITSDLATITFKAGAWNKDNTVLFLTVEGNGVLSETTVTMNNNAWSDYTVYIAGADEDTKIKFYTEAASRFFLDEVKIISGGTVFDYLTVPAEVIAEYSATSASFEIMTASAWTISGAEAVEIDKTSGTGNATVTLTFPANETASDVTIAKLTVTAGEKTTTVVIKQTGNPDAIEELTIAQFLSKEVGDAYYRLTGTIKSIESISYGNFTLVDETGSVYVYGLTKEKVSSNDQSFSSIGVVEGDIVTLEGKRAVHKDIPQVGGPAYYISHVKAPVLAVNPAALVFAADGGNETITATVSNFTNDVTISASSDNTQFTTSVSGTTVTVTAAANTENAVKTGMITITATDGTNTKTATVSVSQNVAVQPATKGTVLWAEAFSGFGENAVPTVSNPNTTVYGGGSVQYACTNGGGSTKIYTSGTMSAGGTAPELLVAKENGTFAVSGIPTGTATEMTLTFKTNRSEITTTSSTSGITISGSSYDAEKKMYTVLVTALSTVSTFDVTFTNTSTNNSRVDDFNLIVGIKEAQSISFGSEEVEWILGTDCELNTAKQGLTVSGAQTVVSYSSSDETVATIDNAGKVTPLKAGSVTITAIAAENADYLSASDSYTLVITDPNAQTKQYSLSISASDFNTTSYAANNNEKTSNAVSADGSKYEVKWTSNQVMKNGNNMQWQKSNGYIYNSTDLGTIKAVTVTSSAGTFTTYYGDGVNPSSSTTVGGKYFKIQVGSATGTSSKVEIVFEK